MQGGVRNEDEACMGKNYPQPTYVPLYFLPATMHWY